MGALDDRILPRLSNKEDLIAHGCPQAQHLYHLHPFNEIKHQSISTNHVL